MLRMPRASTNGMPQAPTFCGGFLQTRFIVESHQVACAERTRRHECKQRLARCDYSIMILDIRVRHLDNPLRFHNGPPRHCTMKIEGEFHYFLAVARQEVYFVQSHLVHLLAMNKFELPPRDNNGLRLGQLAFKQRVELFLCTKILAPPLTDTIYHPYPSHMVRLRFDEKYITAYGP